MKDWEDMSEKEKDVFMNYIKEAYPEIIVEVFDALSILIDTLADAFKPIFEAFQTVSTMIWNTIRSAFTDEQWEYIIENYEPNTDSKTTDSKQ